MPVFEHGGNSNQTQSFAVSTTTFPVSKYSRAYPRRAQNGDVVQDAEWQHYTNPIIRLILDIKKISPREFASVRLRILWSINSGNDAMDADQREVTFEDLDLLEFSNLPSTSNPPTQGAQGLPLKAVYRDSVVGIRYLHPRTPIPGFSPEYRRFQITLTTASAASQLIDSISAVCPCKPNPQPTGRAMTMYPTHTQTTSSKTLGARNPAINSVNYMATIPVSSTPTVPMPMPPVFRPTVDQTASNRVIPPNNLAYKSLSTSSPRQGPYPVSRLSTSSPVQQPNYTLNSSQTMSDSSSQRVPSETRSNPPRATGFAYPNEASDPSTLSDPSPPSSANNLMLPPPLPSHLTHPPQALSDAPPVLPPRNDDVQTAFMTSLRETPSLYNLPKPELEKLVTEIIREEGFTDLLKTLDTMWKVRGLLDR